MIVKCEQGGEHKACDKCRKVLRDHMGRPLDYTYHHSYYNAYDSIVLCEDCRIRWDNMTKLWLTTAIFVVREDRGWVEVIDDEISTVVGPDGKGSAVIGTMAGKPVYTIGRAPVQATDH